MKYMIFLSSLISTLSTLSPIIIAIVTYLNYKMYQEIRNKDQEYKKQTTDLYQAIVIATLIGAKGTYSLAEADFKKYYKGTTIKL